MAHWAAAIQHFLKQVPDAVVVGLTATPPVDRREQEIGVYLSLVGEVDYEVPTPAVNRRGTFGAVSRFGLFGQAQRS